MKKGRHFSSGNVKVYCSGFGLIGNQTSWPALASNLWAPACRLLLKGMFGYWEDIRAAPGLSDIQGQRGDSCVTLQNTKKKKKKKKGGGCGRTQQLLPCTWLESHILQRERQGTGRNCKNSQIDTALNAPVQQTEKNESLSLKKKKKKSEHDGLFSAPHSSKVLLHGILFSWKKNCLFFFNPCHELNYLAGLLFEIWKSP